MNTVNDFPRAIREIENTWIPLADGTRLAARIWLPIDAEQNPVPAILEYLPYRKDDGTTARDAITHPYFAGHGYAAIRVDQRGSGDADDLLLDEYLKQEQDDALEVMAWIAAQPWSSGAVGIIGISWGGFNGLQIAARRPPELKAVISICSTDDRYTDDCHYMGGCVLGSDMLGWASAMFAYNAYPPDPRFVGDRWREMWFERMAHTPPFVEAWLSHQRRDAFWKHGSVVEDYSAITCPVYMVGGWADPYTNSIPRVLAGLPGPRKGLIGPWAHLYPHIAAPGPAIGFLQECLRWWDFWMKGEDTGIMDEPMLRAWILEDVEPGYQPLWPGHWVAEKCWPPANAGVQTFFLGDGLLGESPAQAMTLQCSGAQVTGQAAGTWCPHGAPTEFPRDQRPDDGLSLCFTSAPLAEPMQILGFPELTLELSSDRPNALLAARLCDVAPTGASTLVSWALLNLTHRESHEFPTPLEPGRLYTVSLRLNVAGYQLGIGHRWRLALSPTYWPHAWPSPEPVTLSVYLGGASRLTLPLRPASALDAELAPFAEPEGAPAERVSVLRTGAGERSVRYDLASGHLEIAGRHGGGRRRYPDGLEIESGGGTTFSIDEGDPLSAGVRCEHLAKLRRGDWSVRIETTSTMTANADQFLVTNHLEAFEGNARVFTKTSDFAVPRDLV